MNSKKSLFVTIKVIVSTGLLLFFLSLINFETLDLSKINFSIEVISIVFILFFLTFWIRAIRWKIIVNDEMFKDEKKVSLSNSIKFLFIGTYLNLFLPSGSGDVLKGFFASKSLGNKHRMYLSSIFDKTIAIASLFFISIYSYLFSGNFQILLAGILSLVPFGVIIYRQKIFQLKSMPKLIKNKISSVINDYDQLKTKTIIQSFSLSITGWISTYVILYFCYELVSIKIPIEAIFVQAPLLTLGRLFPFTLNGIGSDEAILSFVFKDYYSDFGIFLIGSLLFRLVLIIIPAIMGFPFFIFSNIINDDRD